jgi:hypothetical protein
LDIWKNEKHEWCSVVKDFADLEVAIELGPQDAALGKLKNKNLQQQVIDAGIKNPDPYVGVL